MRELSVSKNDAGQRLDRFLSKAVPLLPESLLQKYIRTKRVKIDGRAGKRDTRLVEGSVVALYINDEFFDLPDEANAYLRVATPKLDIVYEDENILLVSKAPGILCHSAAGEPAQNTLIAHIQAHIYQKREWRPRDENSFAPALCNRIDRNTGGIVIAAKTAETLRIINEKIRLREIDKYYLCAVHGNPSPPSGTLEGYIWKDAKNNRVYVRNSPEPGARFAATRYRTLALSNDLTLLECELLTGRTHQIRAQLADAGHPLLGDGKYGSEALNRRFNERYQALWSYKLVFAFDSDAEALEYLRDRSFTLTGVPFVEKYFKWD